MTADEVKAVLEAVRLHRDDILRSELAGWLHAAGRMKEGWRTDAFTIWRFTGVSEDLQRRAAGTPMEGRLRFLAKGPGPFSEQVEKMFAQEAISFPGENWSMGELLMLWFKIVATERATLTSLPHSYHFQLTGKGRAAELLNAAHTRASVMKITPGTNPDQGRETDAGNRLYDVFGHKSDVIWVKDLDALVSAGLDYGRDPSSEGLRQEFLDKWRTAAMGCYAHHEIPVNDVTVWDYSRAVGAFFKAAVAKAWIDGKLSENAADVQWAIVAVGYPGLEFVSSAVRITDAFGRQEWIREKLDSLRNVVEFESPLGSEIYRDENGALYLMSSFAGLEDVVRSLVDGIIEDDDDVRPFFRVYAEDEAGLPVWQAVSEMAKPQPVQRRQLERAWKGKKPAVLCPVCQLRPKAEQGEPDAQYLCHVCFQRRRNLRRSKTWLEGGSPHTIWIDEAMDTNGIAALVTGRLGLEPWLTEVPRRSPFRFLTIRRNGAGEKHPVFLRVEACWSTAREFWRFAAKEALPRPSAKRYWLRGWWEGERPLNSYVYEAAVGGGTLAAVWSDRANAFITASNLDYLEAPRKPGLLEFELPQGYSNREDSAGQYQKRRQGLKTTRFHVTRDWDPAGSYSPSIPLMSEPRHFLAIVPGAEAVETCLKIVKAYRERLGKVTTLLPISLGVVFFDRRTPVYAVLQAGKKLLDMPLPTVEGRIENAVVRLTMGARECAVGLRDIPKDEYFSRIELAAGGSRAIGEDWQARVKTAISLIDFVHLESTGQRYRLAYEESSGRRMDPERPTRPLTLDDFEQMNALWDELRQGLTTSQINELFAASEQKRSDWNLPYPIDDPAYTAFMRATVRQAEWTPQSGEEQISSQIARGLLRDTIELRMKILKERGRQVR